MRQTFIAPLHKMLFTMKPILRSLPVFLMVICSIASLANDGDPFLVKSFNMDTPGNLKVKINGGGISVSSHPGNTIKVEMYVRKGSRWVRPGDDVAKEIKEDYDIEISKSANTVSAVVERKGAADSWFSWFSSDNISISFTVYVPEKTSCNLNTSGGSIQLSGVTGKQDVRTSGGSLDLDNIRGDMEARTSGGSINIEKYAGTLSAHTSGGPINLQDARGELEVSTSGGGIKLNNVDGSVEASTSGGGIHASVSTITKYLRLKTSGGSIHAVVPTGLGMDLNLKGNRVNAKLINFNGEADKDKVVGSMNGGGIPVVMATSGGSVNLEYR
jgi:Putative adhesin